MNDFLDSFCPHIMDVFQTEVVGTHVPERSRNEYDFIYVYHGRGSLELDDVTYALTAGNVLHFRNNGSAALRSSANGPLRYYTVRFEYKMIEWDGSGVRCSDAGGAPLPLERVVQVPDPLAMLEEVQLMHRIWTQKQAGYSGRTKLAFLNVLSHLSEQGKASSAAVTTERTIQDCVDYIEQHYQESLERDTLARKFSISSSYFSVLFKKHVGCSPVQYITKVRIEKAMELLKDSNMPVSVVALEVGFNDPLYFIRVFSRQVGITPKQYRKA